MADDYADLLAQQAALARRQKLLDALGPQINAPIVANNWLSRLVQAGTKVGAGVIGAEEQKNLDRDSSTYQKDYGNVLAQEMERFLQKQQGVPEVATQGNLMEGDPNQVLTSGVKADPRAAIVSAMASRLPEMQGLGKMGMQELLKSAVPEKFGHTPTTVMIDGKPQLVLIGDHGTQKPLTGMSPAEKLMAVPAGSALANPTTGATVVPGSTMAPPKLGRDLGLTGSAAADYYQVGPDGKYHKTDNAPKVSATANASSSSVQKGDNEFWKDIGKNVAGEIKDIGVAAAAGYKMKNTVEQLRELRKAGTYTGSAADLATTVNGVAQALGLPGVDENKLANSQAYQQQIAQNLSATLTNSSLARSTTDADMKIIKDALPKMATSPKAAEAVFEALGRSADKAISRHTSTQKRLLEQAPPEYRGPLQLNTIDETTSPGVLPNTITPVPGLPAGGAVRKPIIKGW